MCSQPSGSPVSTAVSDILFAKSKALLPCFLIRPLSLTWTIFSMECFPWIWRHSCSSAAPPPSLSSFPFCLAFQTLVLPRFHPPPPFSSQSVFPASSSATWRGGDLACCLGVQDSAMWREVRGQLPEKQALLQAGRPTGLLRLLALLTPPIGLKRGGGARGGSWDAVEPERVLQVLPLEERGEISWTCFDGQGQKQGMHVKFPTSKHRIEAWLEGQWVKQGGWAPAMWSWVRDTGNWTDRRTSG